MTEDKQTVLQVQQQDDALRKALNEIRHPADGIDEIHGEPPKRVPPSVGKRLYAESIMGQRDRFGRPIRVRYKPHQGTREASRRLKRMAHAAR